MLYQVDDDQPRAGLSALKRLQRDIRSLSKPGQARVANLFKMIVSVGLPAMIDADEERYYLWHETSTGHRIYRCKVRAEKRIQFRFFFLERLIDAEHTVYYVLEAYNKKAGSDGPRVESTVKSRAEQLAEGW